MTAKKVLVVDDEEALVELLAINLMPEGYDVVKAFDGESGLEKSVTEKPDLVILDVRLPGIDGFETFRRIKANEATRQIPVIMASAHVQENDVRKGLALGVAAYVKKPFDMNDMMSLVKKHLKI